MTARLTHAHSWIDGAWVDSEDVRNSINPATYDIIGTYANGGAESAAAGIRAAKRAFRETPWPRDRMLRAKVLNQLADAFESNTDSLIEILSTENGKVKAEATFEVTMVPSKLRYYASLVRTEYGRAIEPKPGSLSMVLRQPMGVAGIIVPWNSPVLLMVRSLAPALAAWCDHGRQNAEPDRPDQSSGRKDHGRSERSAARRHQSIQRGRQRRLRVSGRIPGRTRDQLYR